VPRRGIGIARIRAIIDVGETWRGIKVVIVAEPSGGTGVK
jgi:hypothetical protein